jgi:hypothetical protein
MFSRDPMEANLYDPEPPEEDGPIYLDEDAEPSIEQIEWEPSEDDLERYREKRRQSA